MPADCTAADDGCWHRWVENSYPSNVPNIPWAYELSRVGGYVAVDYLLYVFFALAVVIATYVFGRGDDDYTSGKKFCNLPDLVRILYRGLHRVIDRERRLQSIHSPSRRSMSTRVKAAKAGFTPPSRVPGRVPKAVETKVSISLGRSLIVVSATVRARDPSSRDGRWCTLPRVRV